MYLAIFAKFVIWSIYIAQLLALVILALVSVVRENLRGLREKLKHKTPTQMSFDEIFQPFLAFWQTTFFLRRNPSIWLLTNPGIQVWLFEHFLELWMLICKRTKKNLYLKASYFDGQRFYYLIKCFKTLRDHPFRTSAKGQIKPKSRLASCRFSQKTNGRI